MSSRIQIAKFNAEDGIRASGVVKLVEDHTPTPMLNRRPVEKNPTALDKFEGQQTQYDYSRVKKKDRMKQVHQHNSGYPQLRDELDKRRSVSRFMTTLSKKDKTPKTRENSNSREIKNPRRKDKKTKLRIKTRIGKNKYKKEKKNKLRKKISALKNSKRNPYICDQCGKSRFFKELRLSASNPALSISSVEKCKSHHTRDTMSNLSDRYPDSREPSMSSYHSYMSSGHEPMV